MIKFLISFLLLFSFYSHSQEEIKVSDIKIEGLQRIDPGLVFNNIPFEINDEISGINFSEVISLIYKTGQFKDVAVERVGSVIVISVSEKPIINEINFHGTETFQPERLKEGLAYLNIASGLTFDKADLNKAEQEIANQYLSNGKYTASIKSVVENLERNRVNINFYIEEGSVSRIKSIKLVGVKVFNIEDLLDQLALKTTNYMSWWNKDDRYSKQELSGGLEKIKSFYMDRGYLDFKINSTIVSISKNKKNIYIAITVDEGSRFTIGAINILGKNLDGKVTGSSDSVSIEDLKNQLLIKEGDLFNRKLVNESSTNMTKKLGNFGYAFANVNAVPTIDKIKNVVGFDFHIEPGKKIYVRRINIVGNEKTKDKVIRREMRQFESSWFSQESVDRSKTRLTRTQFFDGVDIETPGVAGVPDQIDINVKVEERNTGQVSIGAGVSSSEGVVGTFGVSQSNFLGTGNNISSSVSTGDVNKTYSLSFTDPYFTDDGISRGFSIYRKDINTKDLGTGTYDTSSYGLGLNFGVPIDEKETITFGSALDMTDLTLGANAPQGYKDYCSSVSYTGSLSCSSNSLIFYTGFTSDSRDNIIQPNKGEKYSITADVSAPVLDMQYFKVKASAEKFFPLSEKITTRLSGDFGYADSYGDELLPFFKNFKTGGPKSVRGFKEGSIGKKIYDASYADFVTYGGKSLVNFSAETFFPVPGLKNNDSFRMSAFVDAGGVFEDSFESSQMRYSAGLGALWLSPFGPLNLSFALPLNDEKSDDTQTFQFGMGTNF